MAKTSLVILLAGLLAGACRAQTFPPYYEDNKIIYFNGTAVTSYTCHNAVAPLWNQSTNSLEGTALLVGAPMTTGSDNWDINPLSFFIGFTENAVASGPLFPVVNQLLLGSTVGHANSEPGEDLLDLRAKSGLVSIKPGMVGSENGYVVTGDQRSVLNPVDRFNNNVIIYDKYDLEKIGCGPNGFNKYYLNGTFPFNYTFSFANTTATMRIDAAVSSYEFLSLSYTGTRAPLSDIKIDGRNASLPVFFNPGNYTWVVPTSTSSTARATGTGTGSGTNPDVRSGAGLMLPSLSLTLLSLLGVTISAGMA